MQRNGILIMSGFAALWFVWGLSALGSFPAILLLVPVMISGGLIGFALRLPGHASPEIRRRVGRIVGRASAIEFVAIFLANIVLASTGHAGFSVCATAGIVGLHFFPLAHYLRVPSYYVAGAALVALAVAGCAIDRDQTRLMTVGLGAAALLWITCLASFTRKTDAGFLTA
jgi:hypothetical protein